MVLMLLEGLSQARRSWQGGLWAMTVRSASVSAVPWREATEISSAPCRQGFKTVRREADAVAAAAEVPAQGEMSPTRPGAPGS